MLILEGLNQSFINGQWVQGLSARKYDIVNPYDNAVITTVPLATVAQLRESFELAKDAQSNWGNTSAEERKRILLRAADYLTEHREDIVDVIVQETGGTVLKANIEFQLSLDVLKESVNMVEIIRQTIDVPSTIEGKVNHVRHLPLGVISSISPFNFPMNLSMRTIAPALALGNSVVRPASMLSGRTRFQISG